MKRPPAGSPQQPLLAGVPHADNEHFAAALRGAEDRLRAAGLTGRRAFAALTRHLASRLGLPEALWPEGPDAPVEARLDTLVQMPRGGSGGATAGLDLFGLAYERFFPDLFKGARGQYFTPRPLVELMVTLADVQPGDRVLDPTCGAGGFLVAAAACTASGEEPVEVHGVEVDPDLATLARLNLALAGHDPTRLRVADFFSLDPTPAFDVVLANPPFSVAVTDPAVLSRYTLAAGRSSVGSDTLFLEAALRWLAPGGRLVTVLPYAVLVNPGFASLRRWVDENAVRDAVLSLPEGVFMPFGGTMTRACVLSLRRPIPRVGQATDATVATVATSLAAVITRPGYDVRRKRYRREAPDELAALTRAIPQRLASPAWRWIPNAPWVPEAALALPVPALPVSPTALSTGGNSSTEGVAPTTQPAPRVPNRETPLSTLTVAPPPLFPPAPGTTIRLLDFTDVDKDTGEVVGTRTGIAGDRPRQTLAPGDLLFGRMRPELNNVALVPETTLPQALATEGSTEWLRLRPRAHPHFVLLALRSDTVRARLAIRSGQTRPRTTAAEIHALTVPDPGERLRARLDTTLGALFAERRRLRARMDAVVALYEAFARGDLNEVDLEAALDRVEAPAPKDGSGPTAALSPWEACLQGHPPSNSTR